jgi:hypothetical protein
MDIRLNTETKTLTMIGECTFKELVQFFSLLPNSMEDYKILSEQKNQGYSIKYRCPDNFIKDTTKSVHIEPSDITGVERDLKGINRPTITYPIGYPNPADLYSPDVIVGKSTPVTTLAQ